MLLVNFFLLKYMNMLHCVVLYDALLKALLDVYVED